VSTVVLVVVAVFFGGMGVFALVAPGAMLRPFAITIGGAQSRSEVRAVYGGYGVAMAALLATAAFRPEFHRAGIMITVAVALDGMAFGRLVSAVVDKRTSFCPNWLYFLVEAVVAGALLVAA